MGNFIGIQKVYSLVYVQFKVIFSMLQVLIVQVLEILNYKSQDKKYRQDKGYKLFQKLLFAHNHSEVL